jgi:uncharacterized protein YbbK (DUF523 family)
MTNNIKLVISACLLGGNVRYDGGNKLDRLLVETFGEFVEWLPVCPETGAGLPVPREPMQLVTDGPWTRLVTRDTKQDRTEVLARWIKENILRMTSEGIGGFILKARSPSCGVHDAELFSASGALIGTRPGLFAEALKIHFPALPLEDEERLRDPAVRDAFLARLSA